MGWRVRGAREGVTSVGERAWARGESVRSVGKRVEDSRHRCFSQVLVTSRQGGTQANLLLRHSPPSPTGDLSCVETTGSSHVQLEVSDRLLDAQGVEILRGCGWRCASLVTASSSSLVISGKVQPVRGSLRILVSNSHNDVLLVTSGSHAGSRSGKDGGAAGLGGGEGSLHCRGCLPKKPLVTSNTYRSKRGREGGREGRGGGEGERYREREER